MSSGKIKGIAEIELKSDRFTGPANKAKDALVQLGTKGKREIEKIGPAADRTKSKLTTLGNQGKQSIEKISQGADRAKQSMSTMASSASTSMGQVGRSATLAGSQVTQSGVRGTVAYNQLGIAGQRAGSQISTGMVQAATSTRQMTAATAQASVGMGVMTLGVAALGTSIGTTFTGMSNLNKAHLKQNKSIQKVAKVTVGLARANDLLSSTQLAVQRFTLSVSKMEELGLQSTDAYTIGKANLTLQLQKLKTAQDDYAVKLRDIKLAEDDALQVADDLQDTYINMTISIANTVLMSAFLAKTLVPNLSKAWIINKAHILANTRAMVFFRGTIIKSIFNLKMFKISMIGATFGFRGLTIGVRAFMLALGPLGIAMIAIGALWTLWETNAFGFRDALQEVWTWLKRILPILAILETLVLSVFPPTTEAIDETGEAAKGTAGEIEGLTDTVGDLDVNLKAGLIPDLQTIADGFSDVETGANKAGNALDEFKKKRESLSRQVSGETSGSFADQLFGLNGIFSQTGKQLAGFRFTTIDRIGREAALKAAQLLFPNATNAELQQLVSGKINIGSRILTKAKPGPIGGGIGQAVLDFIKRSGGNVANTFTGGNFANLGFKSGKPGGLGTFNVISVKTANANRNRLAQGGTRVPGIPIDQPDAVVGGFGARGARKEHLGNLQAARRFKNQLITGFFGTGAIGNREQAASAAAITSLFAEAGVALPSIGRGFGPNDVIRGMKLLEEIKAIVAEQRRQFDIKVNNFVVSANLGETTVRQMLKTDAGEKDLHNITAFQDRIKLEANLV